MTLQSHYSGKRENGQSGRPKAGLCPLFEEGTGTNELPVADCSHQASLTL